MKMWAVAVYGTDSSFFFGTTTTIHALYTRQAASSEDVLDSVKAEYARDNPELKIVSTVVSEIKFDVTFTIGPNGMKGKIET